MRGNKNTVKDNIPQPGMSDTRPATWVSIVMPDHENGPALIETGSTMLSEEYTIDTNRTYTSPASTDNEKSLQDLGTQRQPPAETTPRGDKVETSHTPYGPSSFSVSIEDDKGNIIVISKIEDTAGSSSR